MTQNLPIIILHKPQLGENIGAVARAMMNFGLRELRIVAPRDGWPNPAAEAMSAGGLEIIQQAKLFDTLEEAIADVHFLYATTARSRDMIKPVTTPRLAVNDMQQRQIREELCGILFGPERSGLDNDAVTLADMIVEIPTAPEFPSLNIAHAALVMCYEYYQSTLDNTPHKSRPLTDEKMATKHEVIGMLEHLETALNDASFFRVPEKREGMLRNIRNIFTRAEMTQQEVRTFRGMIKSLHTKP